MSSRDRSDRAFSAEDDREERKRRVAVTLREQQQHETTGWSFKDLAKDEVGCSETYLYRCADPHAAKSATLSVGDAMALPLETRRALATLIMGPGFQVVEEPSLGESLSDDLALIESSMKEHGDVVRLLMAAVRAGAATRSVGADLVRETDEAIRPLLRIRAIGELAEREGVIGLRAVGDNVTRIDAKGAR